ncbi:CLUMA_CG010690, isoform A [Clunio marinus]|uniref:CLUMA_CG010690, isoform A n=1 Tax=Clunio marinus TaxID=568069 RepID=A0A1J1IAI5_9DIPT|nr:CLUMA_CG010690, isoform A [Clunio marinus]
MNHIKLKAIYSFRSEQNKSGRLENGKHCLETFKNRKNNFIGKAIQMFMKQLKYSKVDACYVWRVTSGQKTLIFQASYNCSGH